MANKEFNKEEYRQKMLELSGAKKPALNESTSTKNQTLLHWKKGADGRTYGIIKEHSKYFIKVATGKKENPNSTDFAYIGGMHNRLDEAHDDYGTAQKRLNMKMVVLNEAFGTLPSSDVIEEDIPLNTEIDKEKEELAPEGGDAPIDGDQAPAAEETPAPEATAPVTDEVPADTAPADTTAAPEVTTDETPASEGEGEVTPEGGENGEEGGDVTSEIQSLLGKITQKFGELPEVDNELAKTAINTTITAVKDGIAKMEDGEKDAIIKRIEKNGEKLDEELSDEETEEVILSLNENIKKGTIKPLLAKIIKKEYKKLQESKINSAIESLTEQDLMEMIDNIDFDDEPIDDKINPNDCFIDTDGSKFNISIKGKKNPTPFNDLDDAIEALKAWKTQNNDDGSVFFIDTNGTSTDITDQFEADTVDTTQEPASVDDEFVINEITKIADKSKKLALEFIKTKYADKMMSEDTHSLDEAALSDLFSKAGLSKVFNKAKQLFTGKQVDALLQNQPEIAKDVEEAKAVLSTGDVDQWKAFKVKARKNIVLVMLLLKLLGVGSPLFAQDYNATVPADLKAKVEMVQTGKEGDQTPKAGLQGDTQAVADSTLSKIIPAGKVASSDGGKTYTYSEETPGESGTLTFQFSARGGDKVGPAINVNNKTVEADSKEVEKKFTFIKDAVESLGEVTPEQFKDAFAGIKQAFEARFADSELDLTDSGIVFTHKFLDNDNIAQSNYKTIDGGVIKQGDRIPQGTKVIDLLGAKGIDKPTKNGEIKTKQAVGVTNKKVTIKKEALSNIPQQRVAKANELKALLNKVGLDIETDGEYVVINEQGFFIPAENADQTLASLNNWAKSTLGVDNMFSFSGQQLAQAQVK